MGILFKARTLAFTLLLSTLNQLLFAGVPSERQTYTIGVLAKRGEEIAQSRWSATAEYLTRQIPEAQFQIAALKFKEIEPAIRSRRIDFLLANSGIYIKAEHEFGAFRIVTLINEAGQHALNRFGGVIFTHKNNHSLRSLSDLKGRSFAAVNPTSLGGFLMAKRELSEQGIDTDRDMTLQFFNTHDAVVEAVIAGDVDAGTVRSDTLERMSASGLARIEEIKVLNPRHTEDFPFLLSTRLYPEWPMAALPHTAKPLVEKVSIALMRMAADDKAAISGRIIGWSVPANYETVHELYRVLNIPPHRRRPPTLVEWTRHHPITAAVTLASLVLVIVSLIALSRNNRRLHKARYSLSQTVEKLQSTELQLKDKLSRLSESEHKFTQLAESALDAIIMLDPQGNIEFWNPAAKRIFGYTIEEAERLHVTQWLTTNPDDTAEESQQTRQLLSRIGKCESQIPGTLLELIAIRKSGEEFPIEAAVSSVSIQHGWHVICLARDITQRKIIEAEREQMALQRTQHHKMTALAQLADGIAHEINTPIQTINNNLGFLKEAYQDSRELIATLLELAATIDSSSQYAEKLNACNEKCEEVDLDFLDEEVTATFEQSRKGTAQVSRIVRSMRVFTTTDNAAHEKTDLNKLINDILGISRYQWEQVADLETELDENLPLVNCSPSEMHQALINILMNAVQALEESSKQDRGRITVSSRQTDNSALIEIKDNGNGIPEAAQEHIFNPFFTTRDVGKGTGQGLTLSHDIVVRKHGGSLDYMTESGVGTTFYLKLPINGPA
ncbi:MAG: PhnD/SsuA/transferrin family substrate-binding protein [Candidatus Thiodiazotropha sp.]